MIIAPSPALARRSGLRFVYAPGHIICREGHSMAITITFAVFVGAVLLALAVVLAISFGA